MASRLYTRLALAAAIVLFFAAPAMAQERPLGPDQLPASGVVNYQGTLTGTGFSAPITFTVDFGAGTIQAAYEIPPSAANGRNGLGFGPTGFIDAQGAFLIGPGYAFEFGVPGIFIENSSASFLAGNFFNAQAKNIAGAFIAQFCIPATNVPCPGVLTQSGSYEATRVP